MKNSKIEAMPTILNVDDDDGGRYAVTRMLEHNQFLVREARNGAEALVIAEKECPDLILLDVNLPDINGFEVCRRLKAKPETARIPVLHITATYLRGADMAQGLESGAESYLVEPVEPEVLTATIRSILRARRAEEVASKLAREWQSTFDAMRDGVALLDRDGRVQRVNARLPELLEIPREQLMGSYCVEFWADLPEERQPFLRAVKSGHRESIELEYQSKALGVTVDPIPDDAGKIAGAVQIVTDITEKRQLEEQFRETQKFETIGTLAAGVAHDFNNLLTSIMGNTSLLLSDLGGDDDRRGKLQDVLSASQRAADLTKQLLAYSGKGRHFLQRLDLTTVVQHTRELIEASVPKKVTLRFRLDGDLPPIEADANQLRQVVVNLVSNAAEAIGEESGSVFVETGLDPSGMVYLEVRDTGCGMDAETKSRMFDPFFTTKFTGRGMGLAAVAGIVRGHKAVLSVTSSPGAGSTFRVAFPAEPVAPPAVESEQAAETQAILVVDDEEMVRRFAKATLERRGYHVVMADNGLDAIRQVQRNPQVGLVLLDLTMPVMGGEEAIDQILAAHPGVKVIVSTGYDHREAVSRFSHKRVAGFLLKPYTARQLMEKIQALMGVPRVQ